MRISRFFVDQSLAPNSAVGIIGERAHYIRNV
ncbi:MAG: 16S rRNA U1498 N3-methylase RsmE, partial [Candidatus Azotimanducaceae bacterium]